MDIRQTASLEIGNALANITRLEQGYARMQATAGKPINIPITGIQGALGEVQKLAAGLTGLRGTNTIKISASLAPGTAASLSAALATLNVAAVPVKLDLSQLPAQLSTLRTQLSSIGAGLSNIVSVNTSGLLAVQTQITAQIANLTALIAQLRALGGGGPRPGPSGGSGGVGTANQALLAELNALNNQYKRSDITAAQYGASLTSLQTRLRAAASAATVGTSEFKALDNGLTALNNGLKRIQTDAITKIRVELSGARAAFDAAAASATNYGQRQAAIGTYAAAIASTRTQLQGLATSGALSAEQLKAVNGLLGQTARELNTINGRVNLAGLSGNIVNSLGTLSQFVPGLGNVVSLFSGITSGAGAAALALGVTTVAVGALTAAFLVSFRTAATFQQSLADIKALTQPTAAEFVQLSEAAINIGAPLGVGGREAASAIRELNKAGLSAADALGGGLTAALNLAGAAGINAAEGSKLAVGAMTAFGLTAKDLPAVADTFANFANSTFLDAQDLSLALAAVGPVAKSAGLSLNDFAGLSATLAQGGFKNMSDAGTSLKSVLLALQAPSSTAADALKQLGTEAYDNDGKLKPLGTILESLRGRLKGLTEEGRNAALKDIFGTDGIRAATILLGQSQEAIDANIVAIGKKGEADRVAKERLESYQGSVKVFNQALERLEIIVGQKLLPLGTKLADFFTGIAQGLGDAANSAETFRGYAVALGIVLAGFNGAAILSFFTVALPAALITARTAITAFLSSNPVGIILTIAAGVGLAVKSIIDDTQKAYAVMDKNDADTGAGLLARVAALRKAGDEISLTKAKLLLAQQGLQDAQQGTLTGTNLLGERQYSPVDPKKIEEASSKVKDLTGTLKSLQEAQATASQGTALATIQAEQYAKATGSASKAVFISAADLKTQAATIKSVRAELAGRTPVGVDVTGFEQDLIKIGSDFDKLRIRVKADVKDPIKLKVELAALDSARADEEKAALQKQLATDAADRVKHERDVQSAQLALVEDARVKRQGVLAQELRDVQASYADQIKAALRNAQAAPDAVSKRAFQNDAGVLQRQQAEQEVAIRAKAAQDIAQIDDDRLKKTQEAQQRVLDGQANGYAASIKLLESRRDQEVALAGESATARVAIEARYAPLLAKLNEQQASVSRQAQRSALASTYRQQIQDAQTAGSQRGALELAARQEYIGAVQTLDRNAEAEGNAARLKGVSALQTAEAAVVKETTAKQLEDVAKQTGAARETLAASFRKSAAEAAAAGNAPVVAAYASALDSLKKLQQEAVASFQVAAAEAAKTVRELAQAIRDAQPKSEAQQARATARQPFESVVQKGQEAVAKLTKAFNDLSDSDKTGARLATFQRETGQIQAQIKIAQVDANAASQQADRETAAKRVAENAAATGAIRNAEIGLASARAALSEKQARTDSDQLIARQFAVTLAAKAVQEAEDAAARLPAVAAANLAAAKTPEARIRVGRENDLAKQAALNEIVSARSALYDAAASAAQLEGEQVDRALALEQARAKVREAQAPEQDRALLTARDDLALSEKTLANAERSLALARQSGAGVGELGSKSIAVENARTDAITKREAVGRQEAQTTVDAAADALRLDEARTAARIAGLPVEARALATAREDTRLSGIKLANARQALALLQPGQDRTAAEVAVQDAITSNLGKQEAFHTAITEKAAENVELSQKRLDLEVAQVRAANQITGAANDAVSAAEADLDVTRMQIAATDAQIARAARLSGNEGERLDLQIKRIGLVGTEAEQQRKLIEAERQKRDLILSVQDGAEKLARAGAATANPVEDALNGVADTRKALALATRAYSEAQADLNREQNTTNLQKFQTAQDALTGALGNQRKAVTSLADAYRNEIGAMDGVRDATDKLRAVVPNATGADGKIKPGQEGQEYDRLAAIQARRDQAVNALQTAIRKGDAKEITSATNELTAQQERYTKQAELLKKNGLQVTPSNDTQLNAVLTQLDALSLNYDKEAVSLAARAEIADAEGKAAITFADAAASLPKAFSVGADQIQQAIKNGMTVTTSRLVSGAAPSVAASAAAGSTYNSRGGDTINISIPITLDGQPVPTPEDFRRIAQSEIAGAIQNARRDKAWTAKDC